MQNSNKVELTKIDHIVINVQNLDNSINWYLTSFTCTLLYQSKTIAILQFSNTKLILSLPSDQRPHIGFVKENAQEFGEIMKQSDLCESTFIADPYGNPIELITKTCEEKLHATTESTI